MAGTPIAGVVTLALPRDFNPEVVSAIYAGMNTLARRHEVAIVGGETTTNPERCSSRWRCLAGRRGQSRATLGSGGRRCHVTVNLGGRWLKRYCFEARVCRVRWHGIADLRSER